MAGNTDLASFLPKFGLDSFRPGQRDVVEAVHHGSDVMCVMPTGGGKSLCYQLPSLARQGTTIVVSPLIALMKDQVDSLQSLGIRAKLINSSLSASEQTEVMNEMAAGLLDLVYIAPERLRNSRFLDAISSANVTLLAVDEAHCVSEWGHDFRPDYSRLGIFRQKYLGNVQTIALTATATPFVRDDIVSLLGLHEPKTFVTGFARTNLRFSVHHSKTDGEKDSRLTSYLQQQTGSGIIYAATRKRCEELAEWLPEKVGRPIGVYHAGLDPNQRHKVQEAFMKGKLSAIVATNAFGMGIDKSDIRYVVHYNLPGSLEAYYQEAGRAGRDGKNSDCELLFSYQDRYIQEFFIDSRYPSRETVKKVYEYLLSLEEDPIEMTLEQVRQGSGVKDGSEAVGTAETLLARAGVIRRMEPSGGYAMVRIDSNAPTLLDFLPKEAKVRRKVMLAIEKIVGRRRNEDVYFKPNRLAELAGVDRDPLARTLRELRKLRSFDYVPPFRGRAVHFIHRDRPFDELEIDFEELERRKKAELDKLESVIGFANTPNCRQRLVLQYFGEANATNCGTCDRCSPLDGSVGRGSDVSVSSVIKGVDSAALIRGIRVVLSGVTRMHGRFGKNLVAQMLCGSKNKKLQQLRLNRLSTYGLLSTLKQSQVVDVMDVLIAAGMLEQKEVSERRPTLHITDAGREVMLGKVDVPATIQMSFPLAKLLANSVAKLETGDIQTESAGTDNESSSEGSPNAEDETTKELLETIKRWRRKQSAALGIPAFRILTNATLERLSEVRPMSTSELEVISGIGPATMEQFGYDIVELITGFMRSRDEVAELPSSELIPEPEVSELEIPEPEILEPELVSGSELIQEPELNLEPESELSLVTQDPSALENEPRSETEAPSAVHTDQPSDVTARAAGTLGSEASADAYWTWRLFRDGYSETQIAAIRRCGVESLLEDLIWAANNGQSVSLEWISDEPARQRLSAALTTSTSVG
ncbi:RecQ family ATP-dependent DNA helicase [Rubripirellula amarantea]|nr:RecQ family ATP-dependent DNA helicase [Rubripirellula amarantea]